MPDAAATVAASAASTAASTALSTVGGVVSAITALGQLALTIWGGSKSTQTWTADTYEGVADAINAQKYDTSEGNLFGIGACVLIAIIFIIILIFTKNDK